MRVTQLDHLATLNNSGHLKFEDENSYIVIKRDQSAEFHTEMANMSNDLQRYIQNFASDLRTRFPYMSTTSISEFFNREMFGIDSMNRIDYAFCKFCKKRVACLKWRNHHDSCKLCSVKILGKQNACLKAKCKPEYHRNFFPTPKTLPGSVCVQGCTKHFLSWQRLGGFKKLYLFTTNVDCVVQSLHALFKKKCWENYIFCECKCDGSACGCFTNIARNLSTCKVQTSNLDTLIDNTTGFHYVIIIKKNCPRNSKYNHFQSYKIRNNICFILVTFQDHLYQVPSYKTVRNLPGHTVIEM